VSDLDQDEVFQGIRVINEALEEKIDIAPLVRNLVGGFAELQDEDGKVVERCASGLEGMGKEAVCLYRRVKGDSNKVRLMCEYIRLVGNCSEGAEDDLSDDREALEAKYRAAAKSAMKEDGRQTS
jgi:hypothetical protein